MEAMGINSFGGADVLQPLDVPTPDPIEPAQAGSVFSARLHLADDKASADEIAWRARDHFGAMRDGSLVVAIDRCFALVNAAAHGAPEGRTTGGKRLLEIA